MINKYEEWRENEDVLVASLSRLFPTLVQDLIGSYDNNIKKKKKSDRL